MICPHCNKTIVRDLGRHSTAFGLNDYPYPYKKLDTSKKTKSSRTYVQSIEKIICCLCGEIFFSEIRLGSDMGGDNKYYHQIYKQGQYKFRDFSNPIVEHSK